MFPEHHMDAPLNGEPLMNVNTLRVAVLWGTGFLGQHGLRLDEQRGHPVTSFSRREGCDILEGRSGATWSLWERSAAAFPGAQPCSRCERLLA